MVKKIYLWITMSSEDNSVFHFHLSQTTDKAVFSICNVTQEVWMCEAAHK